MSPVRKAIQAMPLSDIERARGMVIGRHRKTSSLPPGEETSPRRALQDVIRQALLRPPCMLSFSGGRDSSAILAVAVDVAQREGLPLPVPVTLRFPGDDAADEDTWQDQVLSHLGVTNREIVTVRGDLLDVVGPVAQEVLTRHGLLWPFNTHWHQPLIRLAGGGSMITGFGGDEVALTSLHLWAERAMAKGSRMRLRDVKAVVGGVAPRPLRYLRRMAVEDRSLANAPWLSARGRARVRRALARANAQAPLGWDRVLRRELWPSRMVQATIHSMTAMADWYDVQVTHPFVDPTVLEALGRFAPWSGVGGRLDLMSALFGDLLPAAAVKRATKSTFGGSLWTQTARDFVAQWSGEGIDHELVDAERLRLAFFDRQTSAFSCTLMQQAWLGSAALSRNSH